MHLDAFLCNHAEAVNGMLYVAGGGVNACYFEPGAPAPYTVTVGIGMLVTVPWTATNHPHKMQITLLTEDGQEVQLATGPDVTEPLKLELSFNVGRPVHVQPGDDQLIALAANLVSLPMPAAGKYEFDLSVDGDPVRRLPVRVQPFPGSPLTFGT